MGVGSYFYKVLQTAKTWKAKKDHAVPIANGRVQILMNTTLVAPMGLTDPPVNGESRDFYTSIVNNQ
jgi:hypothetical protein